MADVATAWPKSKAATTVKIKLIGNERRPTAMRTRFGN